jgi:hypothetical protein
MSTHENDARELKSKGKNCSDSLYSAFSKDINLSGNYPAPRSVDGKCGALLTALRILEETGNSDKKEDFEKEFVNKFKYSKCIELMRFEARCNDYVGESAKMLDEIINK